MSHSVALVVDPFFLRHVHYFIVETLLKEGNTIIIVPTSSDKESLLFWSTHPGVTCLSPLRQISDCSLGAVIYNIYKLIRIYYTWKPQLFFYYGSIFSILGGIVSKWVWVPAIAVFYDLKVSFWEKKRRSFRGRFLKSFYSCFSEYWFFSQWEADKLYRFGFLNYNSKVRVLPGIIADAYWGEALPWKSEEVFRFLMVTERWDNPECQEYRQAIQFLEERDLQVEWHICCLLDEGFEKSEGKEKSIVVRHTYTNWANLISLMSECHCLVYPAAQNSLPYLLFWGMGLGLPIITTYGLSGYIKWQEGGFLFASSDSIDLALEMRNVLQCNPFKRREIGRKGREHFLALYSSDKVRLAYDLALKRWLDYLSSLLRPEGIEPTSSGFGGQRSIH